MAVGKILIVGLGSVGRRHARNLQQLGFENLVFLRSGRPEVIDEALPLKTQVHSLSEALTHDPTAAVIATPSALHLDVALPLAEHGCHLFVEKPLTTDSDFDRCQQLIQIAQKKNLVTMVGCQFRFHPLLKALREGLQSDRIGTPVEAFAEWGEYLPDWHPWENYREGYAARGDLGGGVMLTLIHPVDYLYWIFGEVEEVSAEFGKLPQLQTAVPDDWAKLELHHKRDVRTRIHLDYMQRPAVHQLSVTGKRGQAKLDFHAGELIWITDGQTPEHVGVASDYTRNDMFVAETKHFIDCIAAKRRTEIPLEDGLAGLRIVAAARNDGQSRNAHDVSAADVWSKG